MNIYRKKAEWPPTYGIKVQVWDHVKTRIKETTMQILPPHELLDNLAQQGQVEDWCVAQPSQEGFVTELSAWGKRMGVEGNVMEGDEKGVHPSSPARTS